jgi:glycosyltransferase involved in cell wall biosynthesis
MDSSTISDAPDVTVVVPTRNRWRFLSQGALPSALAQENVDLEVIVVDDASTDKTATELASLNDERVRVLRNRTRKGLAGSRNAGIAAARGEWLALLDDDDLWAPSKLRKQLDLAASTGASFIYSPALYVSGDRESVELVPAINPTDLTPRLLAGEAIPAGGSNVLITSRAIRLVGGFDEKLMHLGDFDCWVRLDRICRAARCEEPLVAYVQHPTAMHLRKPWRVPSDVRRIHRKHRSQYQTLGRRFDGEAFVLWVAYQHRVAGRTLRAAGAYSVAAWHYRSLHHLAQAAVLLPGTHARALARPLVRRLRRRSQTVEEKTASATGSAPSGPPPSWLAPYLARV